jgi:hypothetical protein
MRRLLLAALLAGTAYAAAPAAQACAIDTCPVTRDVCAKIDCPQQIRVCAADGSWCVPGAPR